MERVLRLAPICCANHRPELEAFCARTRRVSQISLTFCPQLGQTARWEQNLLPENALLPPAVSGIRGRTLTGVGRPSRIHPGCPFGRTKGARMDQSEGA